MCRPAAGRRGVDVQRILQGEPHVGGDDAIGRLERHAHHQLLVRPHGHLREIPELPVDRAGLEPELQQTLLQPLAPRDRPCPCSAAGRWADLATVVGGGGSVVVVRRTVAGSAGDRGGGRGAVAVTAVQHPDGTDRSDRPEERDGRDDGRDLRQVAPSCCHAPILVAFIGKGMSVGQVTSTAEAHVVARSRTRSAHMTRPRPAAPNQARARAGPGSGRGG